MPKRRQVERKMANTLNEKTIRLNSWYFRIMKLRVLKAEFRSFKFSKNRTLKKTGCNFENSNNNSLP